MKKILVLFITSITLSISAQESVVLRYNYQKGDNYDIIMKMTQEMGVIMAQTTKTVINQQTVAVKGDTIIHESKIDRMSMDMVQGGKIMNFDSTLKDDELDEMGKTMKAQLAPIFGAIITSKTNHRGDDLGISVEPNLPNVAEMGDDSSSIIYPKEALKVGSTWSSTEEKSGMIMKMEYKVKSISDKELTLGVGGDISGMSKGTISGNISIDIASGVPMKSLLEMKMNIQGQDMNMAVDVAYVKK